jgi:outer membrane receptor protein involved in Fe transport
VTVPKAPYGQAQWGATLGGPLRKDRTFYFVSYEQLDVDANNFVNIDATVAAALNRNGFPVELGSAPYAVRTRSALVKLEHDFARGQRLLLRGAFSRDTDENAEPFGGIVARSRGLVQRRTDVGGAASLTSVFASGLLNEARLQVVDRSWKINGLDPTCGGPCEGFDQGGPEVTLPGLAIAGRQFNSPTPGSNFSVELDDTLTRSVSRHTLKAGIGVRFIDREQTVAQDMGGRYVFAALPAIPGVTATPLTPLQAFEAGLPALYFQGYGDPTSSGSTRTLAVFAQDRWQTSGKLTLEAGLRYQWYTLGTPRVTVSDVGGTTFSYDIPDRGDLAPRLAIAFDPGGRGRSSIHAAFGLFHEYPLLLPAIVTEVHDGRDLRSLRATLPLTAQAWRSAARRLPEPASFASQVIVGSPGLRAPYARTLSLGLRHGLRSDLDLAVDLLALRGKRQIGPIDYNPLLPDLGQNRRPNDAAGRAGTSSTVQQLTNYGESWYKGATVSLRRRGARWEGLASYTLSKVDDLGSDVIFPSNFAEDPGRGRDPSDPAGLPVGFDARAFEGPSAVDQRHRLVVSGLANLPWRLQAAAILTLASGRPYTALAGVDSNGDGNPANDRARRVPADAGSRVPRNSELTPDYASVDLRLSRRVSIGRRGSLDLIAEAFNLLDRTNFSEVNNVFGPGAYPAAPQRDPQGRASFGLPTKAYAPRQVQLAARLSF